MAQATGRTVESLYLTVTSTRSSVYPDHTIKNFFSQFSINCFGNYFQLQQRITVSVLIVSGINIEIRFPGYQNVTLTVLVFGPESVSYERSRRETAAKFHHFSARVFFEIIISCFPVFPGSQVIIMVRLPVFPGSQVIKMDRFPVFPGSQVIKMVRFPIFPGSQVIKIVRFPIFPGSQIIKIVRFPVFPGSQVIKIDRFPVLSYF